MDQNGSGKFRTITDAIKSLPMFNYQRTVIFVKAGTYKEKLLIEPDYITLRGEGKEKTFIKYSQLRTDWQDNKDEIGPAVINIKGDDFILENITVENTQPEIGPHAFTIMGTGTRTIILNCGLISKGGDTVSLWNYKDGMYYLKGCNIEGAVDMVCPRGWCYIDSCKFYEYKQTAAIWHAGGFSINQKMIIKNSFFDGVSGFELGRHHYEAQFYLLNCTFSENMSDKKIYYVKNIDSSKNRPFNWGERYYFLNCHKLKGDYNWFTNNIENEKPITVFWCFDNKWNPEKTTGPEVMKYDLSKGRIILFFNEAVTVKDNPEFKTDQGDYYSYYSGEGSNTIVLKRNSEHSKEMKKLTLTKGKISGTLASVSERLIDKEIKLK